MHKKLNYIKEFIVFLYSEILRQQIYNKSFE